MSPSIRTWIEEFKNAVFAKVEVENQDKPAFIKYLSHLVNQDSKSNVKNKLHDFQEGTVCSLKKAIDWHVDGKMKEVEPKKYENDFRDLSRPTSISVNCGKPEFQWMEDK